MDDSAFPWWAQLLMALLPIAFIGAGSWMIWSARRFMAGARRCKGVVVDVRVNHSTDSDGRRSVTYQPVFEYHNDAGATVRAPVWLSSSGRNYAIGSERDILVNPAFPEVVRLPGVMVYGFGAIFVVAGILVGIGMTFALLVS